MKNKLQFLIWLFFGFSFLVYVSPFEDVNAVNFQSGATIIPPGAPTETVCDDAVDNDNDGKIDGDDQDCAASAMPAPPAAGTCGLEILSGTPINYGRLYLGQDSPEQIVTFKNVGNASGSIMVKAGPWIPINVMNPVTAQPLWGPELTHVSSVANRPWENKFPLQSSNEIELSQLSAGATGQSYWQLRLPPTIPGAAQGSMNGSIQQQATIDLIC